MVRDTKIIIKLMETQPQLSLWTSSQSINVKPAALLTPVTTVC